ncbi:coagulation factor XIII B chain-like [Branchiostoma floridae x Branchiostoma belcheri]
MVYVLNHVHVTTLSICVHGLTQLEQEIHLFLLFSTFRFLDCVLLVLVVSTIFLDLGAAKRKKRCRKAPSPKRTVRSGCKQPYNHGETCTYRCKKNYVPVGGDAKRTCRNGAWTGSHLICRLGQNCGPPPSPPCTTRQDCNSPYKHKERCEYQCQASCTQVGGDQMLRCYDGTWTGTPLVCTDNCGAPPMPANTNVNGCTDPYTHGEVCNYQCDTGYSQTGGDDSLTCNDGNWDGNQLVCQEDCGPPPTPANTNVNGCTDPYTHGEVCNYQCDTGYSQTGGDDSLTCNDGNWDGNQLVCEEDCGAPPMPANTNVNGCTAPYTHGEVCNYQCDTGYSQTGGDDSLTCNDGVWDGNQLVCQEDCGAPPMPANTIVDGCTDPYTHGEVCNYQCDTGYSQTGGDHLLTCNDGNWDGNQLVCEENCDPPPMPANTIVDGCNDPYTHGEVCNYQCDTGYSQTGGDDSLTCNNGNWDGNQLVCQEDCGAPPMPANTNVNGCTDPYTHGEVCNYQCDTGYSQTGGDDSLTCNDGNWDGNQLVCEEDCGPPPMPDNTNVNGCTDPYTHGEVCNYQCDTGYSQTGGDNSLTCNGGVWDGNQLVCQEDCGPPPTPDNTNVNGCTDPYTHGEVCNYQCDAGYSQTGGDDSLTCNDGNWDGNQLVCQEDCGAPPTPANTNVNGCAAPYTHGEVCNYQCDTGFSKTGGDDSLTCSDGFWFGVELVCEEDCGPPPLPLGTIRNGCTDPYTHGEVCNYQCDAGYSQTGGDNSLTCNDGVWIGVELVCEVDCDPPPMPPGTIRNGCAAPYTHGEVCNYQCDTGYRKTGGDNSLTCNDGFWIGVELVCEANCEEPSTPGNTVLNTCDPPAPPYYHGAECTIKCADGFTSVGGDDRLTCRGGEWILIEEGGDGVLVCDPQTTTPSPALITTALEETTPPPPPTTTPANLSKG